MVVKIRLARFGRKGVPFYRIRIANDVAPRDGKFIETVGTYNPVADRFGKKEIRLNVIRIKYWIATGAQPTSTVAFLLSKAGIIPRPPISYKPLQSLPRKIRHEVQAARKEKKEAIKKFNAERLEINRENRKKHNAALKAYRIKNNIPPPPKPIRASKLRRQEKLLGRVVKMRERRRQMRIQKAIAKGKTPSLKGTTPPPSSTGPTDPTPAPRAFSTAAAPVAPLPCENINIDGKRILFYLKYFTNPLIK